MTEGVWIIPVLLAVLALLLPSPTYADAVKPSPAPAANPPSVPSLLASYDSFRLVHTRNVFDPDRRPLRPATGAPVAAVTQADYAALTGTLLSAQKTSAFFSGSRPEFNKVLTVREKIANATITNITASDIEIERDGKRTTIKVGQTVPFNNQTAPGVPPVDVPAVVTSTDGAATASSAPATPAASSAGRPAATGVAATATTTGTSTAAKAPPGNLDEIRRRMMEKRQQELK